MASIPAPNALLRETGWPHPGRSGAGEVATSRAVFAARPVVRGKFLFVGDRKYWIKGVTYGTFRPDTNGQFPEPGQVARDFAQMARAGINTVRVYTVPPRSLLDLAHRQGLKVMVGLPWEQHVAFLDEAGRADAIALRVRGDVR